MPVAIAQNHFTLLLGFGGLMTIISAVCIAIIFSNPLLRPLVKAQKDKRMAFMHFPNGQIHPVVPDLIEPKKTDGNVSPYWLIDGTPRYKDSTNEKWESLDDVKILNYTARGVAAMSTDHAISIDQFIDTLSQFGFSIRGIQTETFYMIVESAKGEVAEREAWAKLQVNDNTRQKIQEVLTFIKTNPDIPFIPIVSGPFTFRTATSIIDQTVFQNVSYLSKMIVFTEDRVRRKVTTPQAQLSMWLTVAVTLIITIAIAAAIFYAVVSGNVNVPGTGGGVHLLGLWGWGYL